MGERARAQVAEGFGWAHYGAGQEHYGGSSQAQAGSVMQLRPTILFCGRLTSLRPTDRQRFESLSQLGCRMCAFDFTQHSSVEKRP